MTGRRYVFQVVVTKYPKRPRNVVLFHRRFPGKDFFWPNSHRLYRSRSGAEGRLALLQMYGAKGHVERSAIEWEAVAS